MTMRPACVACGNYLLPCTKTATGVHPATNVDKNTNKTNKEGQK